ncbi:hypothetical protein A0J61_11249 [Choanephora cucurbitarum]|uniref:Uncharacterized protein n=1 Tax=Choanephora cucurbitarum TaxID=101091 RepID=A0A1C7MV38_9FUNG|nr:hypothetical protein A0J61_11249 [Choanephora cucurbitarum]
MNLYRNNRSGSSGPSRKPTLNAIDTTVTDADCDCSPSSSTSHNKATDSSSYLSSVSSQLSQNVVISSESETDSKCENKLNPQFTSLPSAVRMIGPPNEASRLPVELVSEKSSDAIHLSNLNTVVSCNLPLYHGVLTSVDGDSIDVHVLIDNGASENYIAPHVSHLIEGTRHRVQGRKVETAGGNTSPITEKVVFDLSLQGHTSSMSAFVFDTKFDIILGRSWLKEHKPKANWLDDSGKVSCCLDVGSDGTILPVQDDFRPLLDDVVAPVSLNYLISKKQAKKVIGKDGADVCLLYLLDDSDSSSTVRDNASSFWSHLPEDFPSVFLDRLPGLPSDRGVQHVIDTGDCKPITPQLMGKKSCVADCVGATLKIWANHTR